MFLGDNVIEGGISKLIGEFAHNEWNSQIVLTRIPNPQQYGVADLADDGTIRRLVENPKSRPVIWRWSAFICLTKTFIRRPMPSNHHGVVN